MSAPWPVRRTALLAGALLVVVTALGCGWITLRAKPAHTAIFAARTDGKQLQVQLHDYDFAGAAVTMKRLRGHADRARSITRDPVWMVASWVPVLGRNVRAARTVAASVASVSDAMKPLETALPALSPQVIRQQHGQVNIAAVQQVAVAMPALSAAVSHADDAINDVSVTGLSPSVAAGVINLRQLLGDVRSPLASSVPAVQSLPTMLGASAPQTWMVLLEQDAEARGVGGIVGSYAILTTDHGKLTLDTTASRATLDGGPKIPTGAASADLQGLWGSDLTEWAGMDLSPNFPWTGQLAAAGWAARGGPKLDYVVAIDQDVVGAMLRGTGPVTVRGNALTSTTVNGFLSTGIYRRYHDPKVVDAVTSELVRTVFDRFTSGAVDLPVLATAMAQPIEQHRMVLWAADPDVQSGLEQLTISGQIPDAPGPFAMAVVNNGGGNKLDAFLHVATTYTPGTCAQDVRIGQIAVRLSSSAPRTGLPTYVSERNDARDLSVAHVVAGSNEELLDIYGPVGASAPLITIDGVADNAIVVGIDREHTVWRVRVPIDPGQTRVVIAQVVVGVTPDDATKPVVRTQPMANPATITAGPAPSCVD